MPIYNHGGGRPTRKSETLPRNDRGRVIVRDKGIDARVVAAVAGLSTTKADASSPTRSKGATGAEFDTLFNGKSRTSVVLQGGEISTEKSDKLPADFYPGAAPVDPKAVNVKKGLSAGNQSANPQGAFYSSSTQVTAPFIIYPPYDPYTLAAMVQKSSTLRPCIESYVTNIESFGYTLEYIGGKQGSELKPRELEEKARIQKLLGRPNPTAQSLRSIRERRRWDLETTGMAYFEVIRNRAGEVTSINHVPSVTMYIMGYDHALTTYDAWVPGPNGGWVKEKAQRHFRKYVQIDAVGNRIYFKEFGDPRTLNPRTGEFVGLNGAYAEADNTGNDIGYTSGGEYSFEDSATEIYCWSLYATGSIYGLPRWIGQLPSILGSRESELVNLNFFRENAIPAMVVLVSGGALTEESFEKLEDYINGERGRSAMQRVMLLEAYGEDSGSADHSQPAPKVEMKPMINDRQVEGLFKDYDLANMDKIRCAFRLSPLYIGRVADFNRASAFAAMAVTEDQVFLPERSVFDEFMNNEILPTLGVKSWKFKSLGPELTDPEVLSALITSMGNMGALTPNVVIAIARKYLNVELHEITEGWGDLPFPLFVEYAKQGAIVKDFDKFITNTVDALTQKLAPAAPPEGPSGGSTQQDIAKPDTVKPSSTAPDTASAKPDTAQVSKEDAEVQNSASKADEATKSAAAMIDQLASLVGKMVQVSPEVKGR